jgi:ABC-2 type transport system ATP-binding protein
LIFLDEPTAGFDPVAAAALRTDLVALVAREGVTVFLTTHNLSEAEKLCAQVGVIRDGKLLTLGNPNELRMSKGSPHVEITGRGFTEQLLASLREQPEVAKVEAQAGSLLIDLRKETEISPLVRMIVLSGGEVEQVCRAESSLEDVFLTLMKENKNE